MFGFVATTFYLATAVDIILLKFFLSFLP